MSTTKFDPQKHFDTLMEIQHIVCHASMLCEELSLANGQMQEKQYCSAAAGAFYMLNIALEKAYSMIEDIEYPFKKQFGAKWGVRRKARNPQG